MTQRQVAALACKILALYAIISSFPHMPIFFLTLGYVLHLAVPPGPPPIVGRVFDWWSVLSSAVPGVCAVGFGVLLWVFADAFARAMADDAPAQPLRADTKNIHAIAFSVVGLLVLLQALPVVAQLILEFILAARDSTVRVITTLNPPMILTAIVQILIGLWLLSGARGLVRIVCSAHDIGRERSDEGVGD